MCIRDLARTPLPCVPPPGTQGGPQVHSLQQAGPAKELPPGALRVLAGVSKKQKLAFQGMTRSAPFCISRSKMLIPRPALGGRPIWSLRGAGCKPPAAEIQAYLEHTPCCPDFSTRMLPSPPLKVLPSDSLWAKRCYQFASIPCHLDQCPLPGEPA